MYNICFIGNDKGSFVGDRIEGFSKYLESDYNVVKYYASSKTFFGKVSCFFKILFFLFKSDLDIVYLVSQHPCRVLPVWAAAKIKMHFFFVIDTGDLLFEMYAETGTYSKLKLWIIKTWESICWRLPNHLVVRGKYFKEYLNNIGFRNVDYIPDGVDCNKIKRQHSITLRKALGLENKFTIGILATIGFHKKLNLPSPGWDLVEVLENLRELPINGVIIGDGPGLSLLKLRAKEKKVNDKIVFVDRINYDQIPEYLSIIDVCLHTALNNKHSMVRTTGKLPIYLACESCVVASSVGTAKYILNDSDLLISFDRSFKEYTDAVATTIRRLYYQSDLAVYRIKARKIATSEFDYMILSKKLETLLDNYKIGKNK